MKNCGGNADNLRDRIMNISKHYQGDHRLCHADSPCHHPDYTPSKIQITDHSAINAYEKALQATYIYRYAESYCRCRDTYWIESFNHQLLSYLPKRIHFGSSTFLMRMNLAIMDWNENIDREVTSERMYMDLRRPDRRTPTKVKVEKTYQFVGDIWKMYTQRNVATISPLTEDDDCTSDVDIDDDATCSNLEEDGTNLDIDESEINIFDDN